MMTKEQAVEMARWLEFNAEQQRDWVARDSARYARQYIEQSQPGPEGWCVEKDDTGRFLLYSPDGGFAVVGKPGEQTPTLGVVYEFLAAMLAAAPKPGADNE